MTAEIAIINRHAIALAADSAVTVGRDKVWKTANKLFSLGPANDIAIMVYGAGDFLGLTWETIVKDFRKKVADKPFRTVTDCAHEFKSFLTTGALFARTDHEHHAVLFPAFDILSVIARESKGKAIDAIQKRIGEFRKLLQNDEKSIAAIDDDALRADITPRLLAFCKDQFSDNTANAIIADAEGLAVDLFLAKRASNYHSGVVLAGFGSDEYHPALSHYIVDGRWKEHLRWWEGENSKNLNTTDHYDEFPIIPFAQDDMSFQFMTGISTDYLSFIRQSLERVVAGAFHDIVDDFVASGKKTTAKERSDRMAKDLIESIMGGLYDKVREEQYRPINLAVSALPKEEMAIVAESLVDLTSLKRKVDSSLETVGGPVDVAVISKGDGFIWIKRKFYFDATKNSEFFERKREQFRKGGLT